MEFNKLVRYGGLGFAFKAIFDLLNGLLTKILYHLKFFKRSVQYSAVDLLSKKRDDLKIDVTRNEVMVSRLESGQRIALRNRTSDIAVYLEIFEKDEYGVLIDHIKERIDRVETIVDVGSNVGISVLYFSDLFPEAGIVAIEPDSSNYSQLQKNIEFNGISDRVTSINAGVWTKDTNLSINSNFRGGNHWSLSVTEDEDGDVVGISLPSIIKNYSLRSIDVLKIDIEGAEYYLFKEPSKCDYLRIVKTICVEIHEEVNSFSVVANTLIEYGFKLDFKNDVLIGYKN